MNRFIEVTEDGYKMLLNLEYVVNIDRFEDGSCRINLKDDYIEPEEPYEIVRYMITKGVDKCETKIVVEDEPKLFYCRFCDCLFEADDDGYKLVEGADGGIFAATRCPDCGAEVKSRC